MGQKRPRILRFSGIFFEDIATSEILREHGFVCEPTSKVLGGGGFFRRQWVSMMIREISFFKFNGKVRPQNIFSHIVMKTNEGTFLTFLRSCGPKQFEN